ncbi:MAG: carboxypeptidase-like regulatory domain-containing protein [Planctomycetaceae bacterium]|jgi:hypothetical protein|nr:carboxypeptidase-like regulatory domain-containing protein [Planctomycetaceae bacterium]
MRKFSFISDCLIVAAVLSVSILITGCGQKQSQYGSLDLVEVTGTVTLDGKPLDGVLVDFQKAGEGGSQGITDANGHYRLMLNSKKSGVTSGEKRVRITSISVGEDAAPAEGQENPTEKIPAKYNRNTALSAIVTKQNSQTFNFDLESK